MKTKSALNARVMGAPSMKRWLECAGESSLKVAVIEVVHLS